ncbi:MAG: thioredoxin [Candidatus Altiarchaeales archaeon HGW-Altiarchaeales-2]|nr:MAG: thioredoxin [Candidatus Altiarchaeales archaeon HGW-Altiarchaeales-2]
MTNASVTAADNTDDELEQIKKKKLEEMMQEIKHKQNLKTLNKGKSKMDNINKPIEVSDGNFGEIVKKYPVVVVDCWAEWCGPCRAIAPVIEELANDYTGKIVFGKLNVDNNQEIPAKYGIMGIPTLLIFKNGQNVDKIVGAAPKKTIEAKIKQYL